MTARPAQCGEDVAAYALGALDPVSARAFERHLAECELCTADLTTLRPAVEALPDSAEPVEPPAELKKRIMAVVESEAKQRRAAARPRRERRRFDLRVLAPVAAAAAAVVLAIVIGGGGGGETTELTAVTQPAGANVVLKMDDGKATLVVEGMGQPQEDHVYQVWKQHGKDAPEPTDALFTTTSDGHASVAVPGDMDGVDRVLVSTEPPGGSERPTTAAAIVVET